MNLRFSQALALAMFAAVPAVAQQASITLKNSDVQFCNKRDVTWTLTKTANPSGQVDSGNPVTFTITATKSDTLGPNVLCAIGYVEVTNTGSQNATIGNIVVNLQRQKVVNKQSRWISAAVDVANATASDSATTANILAAASAEDPSWNSAPTGPGNYAVSGQKGTFTETSASGSIDFTDADLNTVWAIQPQQVIAPGATVRLLFNAKFDNEILQIPAGTSLRTEVIVSFGNAGARGGSGASGTNIDIDGDGSPEAYVRSVPTRVTRTLPQVTICNDTVTLNDSFGKTGSADFGVPEWTGGVTLPLQVSTTTSWTVTATVTGIGTVTNTATLTSADTYVYLSTGVDPAPPIPMVCCRGVDLLASATVYVGATPPADTYCTETHFENNGPQATFLMGYYNATVFPAGLMIGNYETAGGNLPPNGFKWDTTAGGKAALKDYVTGAGSLSALTKDAVNPVNGSGGGLGRHTVTLTLNVRFSGLIPANGTKPAWKSGFGSLTVVNTGTWADGKTVDAILAAANTALASGILPSGATDLQDVETIVDKLNKAFNDCHASSWAGNSLQ